MTREKQIVRTSIIGILSNLFLAAFKAAVGLITHSIAVTLDAVNNLSDALSSVITIIGTRLASRAPDKKHPLGYGRVEYLTATVIAVIVLYAGVTSFVESVRIIIQPETPDYGIASLVIIAAAVVVKLILGRYVKGVGKRVNSDSLIASGEDAALDATISFSTLVAAGIYLLWGLRLEAWLGTVISLVIIKSGLEMLRGTLSEILGERVSPEIAKEVKATISSFPSVIGAYDLILHNYGPDRLLGSVHIEVPDTITVRDLDPLEREISQSVYEKHGVILTGISVYSHNVSDSEAEAMLHAVRKTVMSHDHALQIHGFYWNKEAREIHFDVIIDFAAPDRQAVFASIVQEVQALYPEQTICAALDSDISD